MSLMSLADVKRHLDYEWVNSDAPTTADNEAQYTVGDRWFNTATGYSYELTALTVSTSATWTRTYLTEDNKFVLNGAAFERTFFDWFGNYFLIHRDDQFTGTLYGNFTRNQEFFFLDYNTVFSEWIIDADTKTFTPSTSLVFYGEFDRWRVGDTFYVGGTISNNGFFTITAVNSTTGVITVSETPIDETVICFVTLCAVPAAVLQAAGKLLWYDTFERDSYGVDSESIGTYSYSKGGLVAIGGLGYPLDLVAELMAYKGAVVAGDPITIGGKDAVNYR